MTQFSTPSSSSSSSSPASHKYHFSAHLLSEFHNSICSLFLSSTYPLHLSYFLFLFSPCFLKLISFLSPLFLTTSLILLATFSILSASVIHHQTVDQEQVMSFEALQLYSIVFDVGDQVLQHHQNPTALPLDESAEELTAPAITLIEKPPDAAAIMTLAVLLHQKEELGDQLGVHLVTKSESIKLSQIEDEQQREDHNPNSDDKELNFSSRTRSHSAGGMTAASPTSLGSYGSMRKEKEWRRTLACKLFEERHNNSNAGDKSDEGMDLLWETYNETESSAAKTTKSKSRKKCGGGSNRIVHHSHHSYVDDDNEVQEEEEEMGNDDHGGKLCCLQALKFSTGKMKLGMGKPNLLKISKAIKGIGWLHHVTTTTTTTTRLHSRKN